MDVKTLIEEYLEEARMMQVATAQENQPWACTVYFVHDKNFNLYWISTPERRHSKEIEKNSKSAGVIVLPHTPGDDARGLQFQGNARMVRGIKDVTKAIGLYALRYGMPKKRVKDIITKKDKHRVYVIEPELIVLFDEVNFPNDPRQEYRIS